MKETSIQAFQEIKTSGVLSKQQELVFEILSRHEADRKYKKIPLGLTGGEIRHFAEIMFMNQNTESLPKRLSELERLGVVDVVGVRKCRVKGTNCCEWAINGGKPSGNSHQKTTKAQRKEIALERLSAIEGVLNEECYADLRSAIWDI